MNHQYESEILFRLMERDGFNIPSSVPPYEAEIKDYLINQVKEGYPKLTDYEAEWLLYNETEHLPAEFPIETVQNVTKATFENVVPYVYQSAILKGSTKYRDIDTGDILDTFDETKNLELVSVKVPVLTTTGKNLFGGELLSGKDIGDGDGVVRDRTNHTITSKFAVPKNKKYKVSSDRTLSYCIAHYYKNDDTWLGRDLGINVLDTSLYDYDYLRLEMDGEGYSYLQIEEGSTATSYEPYKSIILTVNEDVELRGIGDVKDELDLITGKLTQRIDEDGEVLVQEVVKTVDLKTVNESGESVRFMPLEGTMHVQSSGEPIQPTFDMSVPVEATTQNLASFIELEMEE